VDDVEAETTINLLTWLWPHLDANPEVAARLQEEVDRVVGTDRVCRSHLAELRYTKMVLDVYPIGWLIGGAAHRGHGAEPVRFRMHSEGVPAPRVAASLRPRERVELTLLPVQRPLAA
jgi:hypothetical protein